MDLNTKFKDSRKLFDDNFKTNFIINENGYNFITNINLIIII